MKVNSLSSIVALARAGSPFYRRLYERLPEEPALHELPLVDQKEFWLAQQRDHREILTADVPHGIVLNSGGTTGSPKFSYLTEEESRWNVEIGVRSIDACFQTGDRVANLFVAGGLHASYIYATDLIRAGQADVLHLPIGYFNPLPDTIRLIRELNVNVLAGMPSILIKLLKQMEEEGMGKVRLRAILYAGESFTAGQVEYLLQLFPGLEIHSAGYASVDAGIIAFADAGCVPGEHRVFDAATIVELLDDETGQPVEEAGESGKVVFTNLVRQLMPIIRYPIGDYATWLEPKGTPMRKFRLGGRAQEGVRVSSVTISIPDVTALLEPLRAPLGLSNFQLLFTTEAGRDRITLRLVGTVPESSRAEASRQVAATFEAYYPLLTQMIAARSAQPTQVEWITPQDLVVSPRTGKTLTIVDRRPPN